MEAGDLFRILAAAAAVDGSPVHPSERALLLKYASGMGITPEEASRLIEEAPRQGAADLPVPDDPAEQAWLRTELLDVMRVDGAIRPEEREFLDALLPQLGAAPGEIGEPSPVDALPPSMSAPSESRDLRMEEHVRSIAVWLVVCGILGVVGLLRAAVAPWILPDYWSRPGNFKEVLVLSAVAAPLVAALLLLARKLFSWSNGARVALGLLALGAVLATAWDLIFARSSAKGPELLFHRVGLILSAMWWAAVAWVLLHRRAARICTAGYQDRARSAPGEHRAIVRSPFFWIPFLTLSLLMLLWSWD